jgi:hypothetical protein
LGKKIRTFRLVWRFLNAPSMRSTIPLDDIALRQRLWYCMKDDRQGIDRSARIVGRDIFSPCRFDGPPGYTCCSSRTLVESFLRLQSPSFHSNTMGGKNGAISSSNNSRSRMRPRADDDDESFASSVSSSLSLLPYRLGSSFSLIAFLNILPYDCL